MQCRVIHKQQRSNHFGRERRLSAGLQDCQPARRQVVDQIYVANLVAWLEILQNNPKLGRFNKKF